MPEKKEISNWPGFFCICFWLFIINWMLSDIGNELSKIRKQMFPDTVILQQEENYAVDPNSN